jgi:hypothetical protein
MERRRSAVVVTRTRRHARRELTPPPPPHHVPILAQQERERPAHERALLLGEIEDALPERLVHRQPLGLLLLRLPLDAHEQ